MNHGLILPILLPMLAGSLLLVRSYLSLRVKRVISLILTWALLPISIWLLMQANSGELQLYALGNWQAPFGIVLMLDRLAALMLVITAVLAGFAMLYAVRGDDERGPNFHALFQFQLLGINGAFLTGDLFNLFVFFEILLIASYSLLVYGGGAQRVKTGVHYVVLNLVASSLFLIGIGILYGLLGTLNLADLALKIAEADAERQPLLAAAGFLLLIVFGLKAAVLPLYFWLPSAYAAATAPVAALFAIMTKVGLYAIVRVFTLLFGSQAGTLTHLVEGLLWPLAMLTLAAGVIGALAVRSFERLIGYLVIVSVGTLLAGISLGTADSLSGALFYLIHSSWICAALFLLADMVARQRGDLRGRLRTGPRLANPLLLGALFFIAAVSVAGLPPFSGFLGKIMLLRAAGAGQQALELWPVVLIGGLGMLVALSRAGSVLFWRTTDEAAPKTDLDTVRALATIGLLACSPLLVVAAQPVYEYTQATAQQLLNVDAYLQLVRGGEA
ncbi:monovalent cation/H+ antiporter subunit D [Phytopseudomonas punonensis]|uniref:Multisubunit potassium/proton antiporter, PhaD subunit n=1 Tax=Phytopseudomonas punonensis TaxID=1220495 RepID=A0A1M6WZA4_9GAMM|nr:monovalent cation/H+ antiporter subunit D [Pseudomonas punonensis]SHK98905.1 multisubunit potassium/proton antiporter, PhaD subunit [Pseudomonas punonensis]